MMYLKNCDSQLPLVSIVVPSYNTSKNFLDRALKSLANQTYNNIEVIVVDDGSKNPIVLSSADSRFLLFRTENMGVSAARNKGVSLSKGDYISFLDADDYLYANAIELLVHTALCSGSDFVFGLYSTDVEEKEKDTGDCTTEVSAADAVEHLFKMDTECGYSAVFPMLVSSQLANHLSFDEAMSLGEDTKYKYELFMLSERIVKIANVLMKHSRAENSLSTQGYNKKQLQSVLEAGKWVDGICCLVPSRSSIVQGWLFSLVCSVMFREGIDDSSRGILWQMVIKSRKTVLLGRGVRPKARIAALISLFGYKSLRLMYTTIYPNR